MPQGFNWVKAKTECSVSQVFIELRLGVEDDIAEINKVRGGSPEKDVHIAQNGNGNTFKVWRGESPEPSIKFRMSGNRIEVLDGNGTMAASYEVSFNDEGHCALLSNSGEIAQWRVRREALEGLFFNS
ncbi:MAG: hypothetical protein WB608_14805 [Terracidiphilus sp.]